MSNKQELEDYSWSFDQMVSAGNCLELAVVVELHIKIQKVKGGMDTGTICKTSPEASPNITQS